MLDGRQMHCQGISAKRDGLLEEFAHVFKSLRHSVRRQALHEHPTVSLPLQSRIQQHQHAVIVQRPDQAAKALFQRDHRGRNLIFGERVAAFRFNCLHARRHHGIAGDGKWKLVDDDAAELFSLHIDALPEG